MRRATRKERMGATSRGPGLTESFRAMWRKKEKKKKKNLTRI